MDDVTTKPYRIQDMLKQIEILVAKYPRGGLKPGSVDVRKEGPNLANKITSNGSTTNGDVSTASTLATGTLNGDMSNKDTSSSRSNLSNKDTLSTKTNTSNPSTVDPTQNGFSNFPTP